MTQKTGPGSTVRAAAGTVTTPPARRRRAPTRGEPVAVEPLQHGPPPGPRQPIGQGLVLPEPDPCRGERVRVVGGDEEAVVAVADQLGDAGHVGGDDGRRTGHRLEQDVGNAVSVAAVDHPAGQAENRCPAVFGEQLPGRERPDEPHGSVEPVGGGAAAHHRLVISVLTGDDRLERHPLLAQSGARIDERVEALLRHQPADAEDPQPGPATAVLHRAGRERSEVRAQAVVDDVDPGGGAERAQVPSVGFGARDHERRRGGLASQEPGRVEVLPVEVLGVAGEREGEPGDRRRQPRDGGRAVSEVGVQVGDGGVGEDRVGQRDGEQELLQVDLARCRQRSFTGPNRLGERHRRRAHQSPGSAARHGSERGKERTDVAQQPGQGGAGRQRRRGGQVAGGGPDPVDDRVPIGLVRRLEDEDPGGHTELLDAVDLAGDERLRTAREPFQYVGDGALSHTDRPGGRRGLGCRPRGRSAPSSAAAPPDRGAGAAPDRAAAVAARRPVPTDRRAARGAR